MTTPPHPLSSYAIVAVASVEGNRLEKEMTGSLAQINELDEEKVNKRQSPRQRIRN